VTRVKVRLVEGWHIYVDGVQHSGPEVVEVAEDHAAHLVERGVALEEPTPKARRGGQRSE
jgi:hypothetical protein